MHPAYSTRSEPRSRRWSLRDDLKARTRTNDVTAAFETGFPEMIQPVSEFTREPSAAGALMRQEAITADDVAFASEAGEAASVSVEELASRSAAAGLRR